LGTVAPRNKLWPAFISRRPVYLSANMTGTRRLLTTVTVLLVVLSVPSAVWGLGTTAADVQQETGPTVEVTDLTSPKSTDAGQTINVTATVTLTDSSNDTNVTATPTQNETTTNTTDTTNETTTNTTDTTNETTTNTTDTTNETTTNTTATPAQNDTNVSDQSRVVPVEFRIDGEVFARQDVTLKPGESRNVTFQVNTTGLAPGTYVHSVLAGDSGEDSSIIVVRGDGQPAPEPNPNSTSFRVTNLTAPDEVTAGESVEVTAEVANPAAGNGTDENATNDTDTTDTTNETTNDTDTTDTTNETTNDTDTTGETQTVEFRLNGDVVAEQNVTLSSGETTTVNFTLETTDVAPDIYSHGVLTEDFGQMGTLTVTEPTTNETTTPAPNDTDTTNETTTNTTDTNTTTPVGTEAPGTDAPNGTSTEAPGTTTPTTAGEGG
jgi:hypothetical protein